MTLKFNRVLEVVEVRVRAKFHQANCSGSRVIVLTEKKTSDENYTAGMGSLRTVLDLEDKKLLPWPWPRRLVL